MPESVGVRELRQNLSRYLDRVKAGEPLVVTEHGREVARLVPSGAGLDAYAGLAARFGASVPAERLGAIAARLPPRPGMPAGTTDDLLAEGRAERGR
jgi:prevent-host-death family protein